MRKLNCIQSNGYYTLTRGDYNRKIQIYKVFIKSGGPKPFQGPLRKRNLPVVTINSSGQKPFQGPFKLLSANST